MADRTLGIVNISNDVIAEMAGYAALECYGVVGMASPTARDGVAQLLSRDRLRKGVSIAPAEDGYGIDLYIVAEYGTNLAEVARNMAERVRYVLTTNAGVKVATLDVHVQDIKVRK